VRPALRAGHGLREDPGSGPLEREDLGRLVRRQARLRMVPHIPIINSNNAGLTFLDAIHTAAAASTKVSLNVVQLRNKFVG
jgi:hypothetical protein